MYRTFLFLFLLMAPNCFAQSPTDTVPSTLDAMIDSLNIVKSPELKIDLSQRIATYLTEKDWNRAITYLELAKSEAKKQAKNSDQLAEVYITAAHMYYSKDVLDVTLDYYQKAYALYHEAGNTTEEIKIENNLAIIYARLQNKDKALLYFRKVYEYQVSQGDSLRIAQILNNIGTLFLESNTDSSLHYFKESLPIVENLKKPILSTYVYTNIARAYAKSNDSIAMEYFGKALHYANSTDDKPTKSLVFSSFANFYYNTLQYDSAIYYANKTMLLQKDNTYSFISQDVVKTLYESYLKKENFKEAAAFFEEYNTIRDSLNVVGAAVNVERLKLQQEYHTRTQIQNLKEERARFRYYFVGLALLAGILILLLIIVRFRNRIVKNNLEKDLLKAKQKELRYDLDVKNQVMISKAMAGMHQSEVIGGIMDDLKKLRLEVDKKSNQHSIDQIQNRMKRDLNTDSWQEFDVSFEQVHKSFYTNLTLKHPDLTPKDRRLCALLYLDLSSKEISQITGQSYKAIENARTRLRKKLELTNEKVNLSSYLIGLE